MHFERSELSLPWEGQESLPSLSGLGGGRHTSFSRKDTSDVETSSGQQQADGPLIFTSVSGALSISYRRRPLVSLPELSPLECLPTIDQTRRSRARARTNVVQCTKFIVHRRAPRGMNLTRKLGCALLALRPNAGRALLRGAQCKRPCCVFMVPLDSTKGLAHLRQGTAHSLRGGTSSGIQSLPPPFPCSPWLTRQHHSSWNKATPLIMEITRWTENQMIPAWLREARQCVSLHQMAPHNLQAHVSTQR